VGGGTDEGIDTTMCLAIPARITEIHDSGIGRAEVGGVVRDVNLCLVDDVAIGDYIIMHVGFALSKLDLDEAEATLRLFEEAGLLDAEGLVT
jgi:hydrogenase expression/formation protein HypC